MDKISQHRFFKNFPVLQLLQTTEKWLSVWKSSPFNMKTRSPLVRFLAAFTITLALTAGHLGAQVTTFNDATNDIAAGIATAGGTLDIVKMEVVDTETDVQFTMTVNGNFTAPDSDWGNFMVGIANQKTPGSTTGNGWNRPINLNAGGGNGMTHWIGSWNGGSQLWTYQVGGGGGTSNNWSGPAALVNYSRSAATQSTVIFTVSKESLGVTNGDTIIFDAYSSGGGGGDSAVDALSNPTNSITDWGQTYTSSATNTNPAVGIGQTRSYTLANTALNTTQDITFTVDMSAQIAVGAFDPAGDGVSVEWGSGFALFQLLTPQGNGMYSGVVSVSAPANTPVAYRFVIEPEDPQADLIPETVSRNFLMPEIATTLPTVYYDNIQAYRDVTFTVNMSVQETLGNFDPASQTVEVRGSFNNFGGGNTLASQGGGIYSATFRVGGTPDATVEYKFFTAGTGAAGYESGNNRAFTFAINPGGAPTPALVLPTVFFSNQDVVPDFRPVTFSVDMNQQITLGNFNPTGGVVQVRGPNNNWDPGFALTDGDGDGVYTGTVNVIGAPGTSVTYKFWATGLTWESTSDRTSVLGPTGTTQVLPTVFFNNDSGQTRQVTFSVDMSVQQALGLFNPATGIVQLRGLGGFGEAQAQNLAREGTTLVYSGTFAVPGDAGSSFSYKFYSPGVVFYSATDPANTGFEIINQTDAFENRSATLDANGVAMNLPVAYFSNQLFYTVGSAPNAFSTTQGTASAAQSITINGQGLTANIVATAPTGFEVSADGITYGGTADIVPSSGSVTGTGNLFIRLAASAAAGSPSGNVALTSTASQPVNIAVTGTVEAVAETFANWSGGATLTPALQLQYAIGGASSPTATNGVPSVTTVTSNTLSITAVVRTNDPTLTVIGQSLADLATGPWSTNDVTMTPEATAAPEGCQVQTFSTPRGTDGKKFLRLQTSLPAAP
jgi:hypothetical protein